MKPGFVGLVVAALCTPMVSPPRPQSVAGPYQPDWVSLARHENPQWLLDAKFGIYAHWGVYAVAAYKTEWYGKIMYDPTDKPAHYGIRTKDYKLIFFYGLPLDAAGAHPTPTQPGWELYDLRKDPLETTNVYGTTAYADVARSLKAELDRIKREIGDTDEHYPELMLVRKKYWD